MLFTYKGDRHAWLAEVRQGLAPDEFLYGLPYLSLDKFDVDVVDDPHPFDRFSEAVWRPFQQLFGRRYRIGFNFHFYWTNRRRFRSADLIVTTADSYGLPLIAAKRAGRLKSKIIYVSQGLYTVAELARHSTVDEIMRRIVGGWLEQADTIVVFGDGDAEAVRSSFGDVAHLKMKTLYFGVDERFWTPKEATSEGDLVLSVGSDVLRDYPLLLRAIGNKPLRIVTRLPLPKNLVGDNVTADGEVSWLELRELYRTSRFVASPIVEAPRNSGHSATLQAMACGKAVILSDTRGLWDRRRMKHLDTCYLVQPGNVEKMAEAIDYLYTHPEAAAAIGRNARRLVEEEYSSKQYGEQLQRLAESLLGGPPLAE
ncbi:MAG: glycosyltransferase family 4 protein [Chloroflexota bacterium]